MYKTGGEKKTALKLFRDTNKLIVPEPIEQNEAEWIENTSFSPLISGERYDGPLYKYDICSAYPAIMANKPIAGKTIQMKFPFKSGEFNYITNAELKDKKFFSYGIYRCKIEQTTDSNIRKLFKYNIKHDYYTHLDLNLAREHNLDIIMIEDGKANQLLYSTDRLAFADKIFGPFVNILFPLKQAGIKIAKETLNNLWGALCEKRMFHSTIGGSANREKEIEQNVTYEMISTLNDNEVQIQYCKNSTIYETNWARIKPFMISRGRCEIARILTPHIEYVKKCHTDSMFVTKKLDIETGFDLGNLKYEGYCPNAQILNLTKTIGDFIV
jgi:hypothetical protein